MVARAKLIELRDASPDAWLVFADELLDSKSAEDRLRGELIRVQIDLDGAQDTVRDALLLRQRELLSHDSLAGRSQATFNATWKRGFLSHVRASTLDGLRMVLSHLSGAIVDELVLDNPRVSLDEQVTLVGERRPAIRGLVVRSDDGDVRFNASIPAGPVLQLPGLERLELSVRQLSLLAQGTLTSSVKELRLSAVDFAWTTLNPWSFPQLEVLELAPFAVWSRTHSHAWDVPDHFPMLPRLERMESGEATPALKTLRLSNFTLTVDAAMFVTAWASRVPLQLLDVSECNVIENARGVLNAMTKCELRS